MAHQLSSLRKKANRASQWRCKTLICVLENPKTIENVCQIIRTIDNLGVAKLYVVDNHNLFCGQPWSMFKNDHRLNALSASAIKYVYVKTFATTNACFQHLKPKNFISIGTSPHIKGKHNISLKQGTFTDKKLAVWFGNESVGLSKEALTELNTCIQIEMTGIIESLNLSVSAGIVLYEIVQQRHQFL